VYEVKALAVGLQIIHESCQYVHEGVRPKRFELLTPRFVV
jgi:hypothetical protein